MKSVIIFVNFILNFFWHYLLQYFYLKKVVVIIKNKREIFSTCFYNKTE